MRNAQGKAQFNKQIQDLGTASERVRRHAGQDLGTAPDRVWRHASILRSRGGEVRCFGKCDYRMVFLPQKGADFVRGSGLKSGSR